MLSPATKDILESLIYKFGPFKNLERTLKNKTIGFSKLADFNDTHESEYRIAHFFNSIEDQKKLFDGALSPFTKIRSLANDYLDNLKVTCFSHTWNSNLMWSHYAEKSTGVCYCFEFKNKQTTPFEPAEITWGNVIYSSLVPEIKIFQEKTTEGMIPTLFSDVVLTKSNDWSYEREIRFFKRLKKNYLEFNPKSLKAIIIGRRTNKAEIEKAKALLTEYNKHNSTDVKILYCHRIANRFELGLSQDENFRTNSESSFNAAIPVMKDLLSKPVTSIHSTKK